MKSETNSILPIILERFRVVYVACSIITRGTNIHYINVRTDWTEYRWDSLKVLNQTNGLKCEKARLPKNVDSYLKIIAYVN